MIGWGSGGGAVWGGRLQGYAKQMAELCGILGGTRRVVISWLLLLCVKENFYYSLKQVYIVVTWNNKALEFIKFS